MKILDMPPEAKPAVRARQRREIDEIDYRREVLILMEKGYTQRQVSRWLGIAQPTLSSVLKTAKTTPMPRDGFSGASPMEICQRYAAGRIDRAKLINELTRWEYTTAAVTDGFDSLMVNQPGSFDEVIAAVHAGLIESEVYGEVLQKLRKN